MTSTDNYQSLLNLSNYDLNVSDIVVSGLDTDKLLYLDDNSQFAAATAGSGLSFNSGNLALNPLYSPTFAGLTLTGLSGVLKATAGVVSGSATTSDLAEGSNQYFTSARVRNAISAKALSGLYWDSTLGKMEILDTIPGGGTIAYPSSIVFNSRGQITNYTNGTTGVTSITGTTNQVIASASTGAVTLSLPQSIATTSSPTFANLRLNGYLDTSPTFGTPFSFSAYSFFVFKAAYPEGSFGAGCDGTTLWYNSDSGHRWYCAGVDKMYLKNNGNLGIGGDPGLNKLYVNGGISSGSLSTGGISSTGLTSNGTIRAFGTVGDSSTKANYSVMAYENTIANECYGIGVESSNLWFNSNSSFKWYSQGVNCASLSSTGRITLAGGFQANSGSAMSGNFDLTGNLSVVSSSESNFKSGDTYLYIQPVADNRVRLGAYDSSHGFRPIDIGSWVGIGGTEQYVGAPLELYRYAPGNDSTAGGILLTRYSTFGTEYRGGAMYSRYINSAGFGEALVFGVCETNGKNPYADFDQMRMSLCKNGLLHVGNTPTSTNAITIGSSDATHGMWIRNDGSHTVISTKHGDMYYGLSSGHPLNHRFFSDGTENATFDSYGNAWYRGYLSVGSSIYPGNQVVMNNATAICFKAQNGSYNTSTDGSQIFKWTNNEQYYDLMENAAHVFRTNSYGERMRISSSGVTINNGLSIGGVSSIPYACCGNISNSSESHYINNASNRELYLSTVTSATNITYGSYRLYANVAGYYMCTFNTGAYAGGVAVNIYTAIMKNMSTIVNESQWSIDGSTTKHGTAQGVIYLAYNDYISVRMNTNTTTLYTITLINPTLTVVRIGS